MGNRCVTDAIQAGLSLGACKLDRCVLAAADVDRKHFEDDIGTKVIQGVEQLTLYASANDKALLASHSIAFSVMQTRLGDAKPTET
jgi:esterase/lipase superfamily enzyme